MSNIAKRHIFVVDDEVGVCQAIRGTLQQYGAEVTCFDRAAECLEHLPSRRCDLLITDLRMPEMDGMELLKRIVSLTPTTPVVILTGYGDIPTAVKALKAGAVDFVEKPPHKESFVDKIESILQESTNNNRLGTRLSKREREVLRLVVEGKTNKEIATLLSRSTRTIEVHRSHIMHKLGVKNVIELVKWTAGMGMVDEVDWQTRL